MHFETSRSLSTLLVLGPFKSQIPVVSPVMLIFDHFWGSDQPYFGMKWVNYMFFLEYLEIRIFYVENTYRIRIGIPTRKRGVFCS